jgi:AcrR family transcriptional regulator
MYQRGTQLQERILHVAKDVFLELGFERASMDVVADRARTSKRTLYARFESKEALYLAVVELVRGLFIGKLKSPSDYSENPSKALVMYCGRFLELLLFGRTIRMCRVSIAEAARFAEGSARYYDVLFATAEQRLGAYIKSTFGASSKASSEAVQRLLGRIIYPRFPRALFGLDEPTELLDDEIIRADFDLGPVRKAVAELIQSLRGISREGS